MGKLTSKARNKLPASDFGLPAQRKYPLEPPPHAANAKARASQQFNKGNITAGQKSQIDSRANARMRGGSRRGT